MPDNAIIFENVQKIYQGNLKALDDFCFTVKSKSVTALLGPNGAGKSTAMKVLAGLITDYKGNVTIWDRKLPIGKLRNKVGYMPQQNALYSELSVRENWDFFAAIGGIKDKKTRKKNIEELLPVLDLVQKADTQISKLSGGMKQRVSLGCALAHKPLLLLLDEPTVGLDPDLRKKFWEFFSQLAASGSTILLTTHVFDEIRYCSDIAFLRQGKLLASDTKENLCSKHNTSDIELIYMKLSKTVQEVSK